MHQRAANRGNGSADLIDGARTKIDNPACLIGLDGTGIYGVARNIEGRSLDIDRTGVVQSKGGLAIGVCDVGDVECIRTATDDIKRALEYIQMGDGLTVYTKYVGDDRGLPADRWRIDIDVVGRDRSTAQGPVTAGFAIGVIPVAAIAVPGPHLPARRYDHTDRERRRRAAGETVIDDHRERSGLDVPGLEGELAQNTGVGGEVDIPGVIEPALVLIGAKV